MMAVPAGGRVDRGQWVVVVGVGPSAKMGATLSFRPSTLNRMFSSTAVTAAALMPESKIVWNQVGHSS